MKVLISGGLGNLGSWITKHLVDCGFEVTTFSSGDRDVLKEYRFKRLFGDITNETDTSGLFYNKQWDVVINLASVSDDSITGFNKKSLEVNTLGTRNLLQAIASCENKNVHFIYFSTFHVYGVSAGIIQEETTFPEPKNDYASTHLFAEYYVNQFHHSAKIPFTIFRLTNSYGCPKEMNSSKWHLIVNDLAKTAVEKGTITLKTNGKPKRDFIWMGDVCEIVKHCMNKGPANTMFNLGAGRSTGMLEIAQVVKQAYEDYFRRSIDIEVNMTDDKNYDEHLQVVIDKLQNWIAFSPHDKIYDEATAIFKLLGKANNLN